MKKPPNSSMLHNLWHCVLHHKYSSWISLILVKSLKSPGAWCELPASSEMPASRARGVEITPTWAGMIRVRDPPNHLAEILSELGRHQAGHESLGRSHLPLTPPSSIGIEGGKLQVCCRSKPCNRSLWGAVLQILHQVSKVNCEGVKPSENG